MTFLKSLLSAVKLDSKWDSPTEEAVEGKKAFSAIYSAWGECAEELYSPMLTMRPERMTLMFAFLL